MIDLHSHLLPGVDDGAADLAQALAMARMAVADGVTIQACTPHIFPGVYPNQGADIRARVANLQQELAQAGIPLTLAAGADVHVTPDLVARLRAGAALTLHDSRYVLVETPHHVLPPRADALFFELLAEGYVPILTHPERMTWIDRRYDFIRDLVRAGAWMQLTAGALLGNFGANARYWSERMLDEGLIHIVASDAHDVERRPPGLRRAFEVLRRRVGDEEAVNLVERRPYGILADWPVARQPPTRSAERAEALPEAAPEDTIMGRLSALWRGR